MTDEAESRERLMQRADDTRAMLLHTVERLDRRRHEAFDFRLRLERHFWQLAVAGAVLLLATAGAVALIARRTPRRQRPRWSLAKLFPRHPDSLMLTRRRPFLHELARELLLPILGAAVRRALTLVASGQRSEASAPIA